MPRKRKPSLEQQLATTDNRKSQLVSITPTPNNGFSASVLPEGLKLIETMAAAGKNKATIAKALGISLHKFRDVLRDQPEAQEAWTVGLAADEDECVQRLRDLADGKRSGSVVALIWLMKNRFGWRDVAEHEVSRPMVQVINLRDSMSPEEYLRLYAPTVTKGLPE